MKANNKRTEIVVQGSGKRYNRKKATIKLDLIQSVAQVCRAMDSELRIKLMEKISEKSEICVQDLYNEMKIEQSVCSQHLGILRRAGLLHERKEGKKVFYSINIENFTYTHDNFTTYIAELSKPEAKV